MKIYLAGPIFKCDDDECVVWREEAKKLLKGFEISDPMERDYRGIQAENIKDIVEGDKAAIDSCDALLVNFLKPSAGTSMEILYAWERKIPVYVIYKEDVVTPWVLYHAERIFKTLPDAADHIRNQTVNRA